eukprot:6545961-Ditylum_brightwellii.AAC.1
MPGCCGVALFDEARIPCNGKAPCVRVLKLKPVKRGWTLWCGETVLNIVREHRWPGTEDPPFANVRWAMDNWFTSKSLFDELLRLRKYPYGTMELK